MSDLILPGRLTQQPQWAAQIDWSNPITKGLILDINHAFGVAYESVGLVRSQPSTLLPIANSGNGRSQMFTGTGYTFGSGLTNAGLGITDAITMWSFSEPAVSNNWSGKTLLSLKGDAGSVDRVSLGFYGNSPIFTIQGQYATFGPTPSAAPHIFCATYKSGVGIYVFVDKTVSASNTGVTGVVDAIAGSVGVGQAADRVLGAPTTNILCSRAWNRALSAAEVASLVDNPWQIYKAPARRLWLAASSGSNVTASLTGATATGSAGTLVSNITVAATGQTSTSSQGTVTPSVGATVALTGQSSTASAGSATPSTTVATTGQSATGSPGSVSASQAGTAALTGQSSTASAGSLASQRTVGLTGQSATSQAGNLSLGIVVPLSGQSVSTAQGTLTASTSGNRTSAITGQSLTALQGTVSAPQKYPQAYCYTLMRASAVNASGYIAGVSSQATLMRSNPINAVSAMSSSPINRTVSFV